MLSEAPIATHVILILTAFKTLLSIYLKMRAESLATAILYFTSIVGVLFIIFQ